MNVNPSLKDKLTLVVLGRSGSGKGTQAQFILKRLTKQRACRISTGDLLRSFMKGAEPTARLTHRTMHEGILHPSWLAAFLWMKELIERGKVKKHIIFDGAVRAKWEAELADSFMRWHGRVLPWCIYIDVSRKEAARRLFERGRFDDTKYVIRNRLAYFIKSVVPVVKYFKKHGRLIRINGEQPIEKVRHDIDKALAKRLGRRWPKR